MKRVSIKTFVATGVGAALFFVLARFASIPTPIPNTTINIQYAVLALFSAIFGPLTGSLIGLIGHALNDFSSYGPWWSWIISSAVVGAVMGITTLKLDMESGVFGKKEIFIFNTGNVLGNAFGWFLIAPILDILIYAEPSNKVFTQGLVAGIGNIVTTAILGTVLAYAYSKTRTRSGSLSKEGN